MLFIHFSKGPSQETPRILSNRQNENVTFCDVANKQRVEVSPFRVAVDCPRRADGGGSPSVKYGRRFPLCAGLLKICEALLRTLFNYENVGHGEFQTHASPS